MNKLFKRAALPFTLATALLASTALDFKAAAAEPANANQKPAVSFASNSQPSTNKTAKVSIPVIDNRGKPLSELIAMSASKGAVAVLVNADKENRQLSSAVYTRTVIALRGLKERGYVNVGIVVQDGDPRQAVIMTSVNSPDGDFNKNKTYSIELSNLGNNVDTGAYIATSVTELYHEHLGKPTPTVAAANPPAALNSSAVLASIEHK